MPLGYAIALHLIIKVHILTSTIYFTCIFLILIKNHYDDTSSMYWYFEVHDGIFFYLKVQIIIT